MDGLATSISSPSGVNLRSISRGSSRGGRVGFGVGRRRYGSARATTGNVTTTVTMSEASLGDMVELKVMAHLLLWPYSIHDARTKRFDCGRM